MTAQLNPEARHTVAKFFKQNHAIDYFSGCEVLTQHNVRAPGLNMLRNSLHLNSADRREAFVRQYCCTTFDWDAEAKQAERAS